MATNLQSASGWRFAKCYAAIQEIREIKRSAPFYKGAFARVVQNPAAMRAAKKAREAERRREKRERAEQAVQKHGGAAAEALRISPKTLNNWLRYE